MTESDGKDAQEQRKTRGVQTPENSRTERVNRHSLHVYTSGKAEQRRRQASEPSQLGYGTLIQGLLGARLHWDLTLRYPIYLYIYISLIYHEYPYPGLSRAVPGVKKHPLLLKYHPHDGSQAVTLACS